MPERFFLRRRRSPQPLEAVTHLPAIGEPSAQHTFAGGEGLPQDSGPVEEGGAGHSVGAEVAGAAVAGITH